MSETVKEYKETLPYNPKSKTVIVMTIILNICLLPLIIDVWAWCFPLNSDFVPITHTFGDILYGYLIWLDVLFLEIILFKTKAFLVINSVTALLPLLTFLVL